MIYSLAEAGATWWLECVPAAGFGEMRRAVCKRAFTREIGEPETRHTGVADTYGAPRSQGRDGRRKG